MTGARRVLVCAALLLTAACSRTDGGVAAWNQGRFEEAHREFAAAAAAAGDGASAELLYDRALAAVRVGRIAEAESAADAAAAHGGSEFAALRDFLRGNAAFARCELAAAQARSVEAEPFALDVAIAHAESARKAWSAAAASREDWPDARRNVERAMLRAEELRKRKSEADASRKRGGAPEPRPVPLPPPPRSDRPEARGDGTSRRDPKDPSEETASETPGEELGAAEVARLFEILATRERERAALRRSRRDARSADVERDW